MSTYISVARVFPEMEESVTPVYCSICMCLYTAYLVLTRYWRKVDANYDGIPDTLQQPSVCAK